jgi:hypothetical protein
VCAQRSTDRSRGRCLFEAIQQRDFGERGQNCLVALRRLDNFDLALDLLGLHMLTVFVSECKKTLDFCFPEPTTRVIKWEL